MNEVPNIHVSSCVKLKWKHRWCCEICYCLMKNNENLISSFNFFSALAVHFFYRRNFSSFTVAGVIWLTDVVNEFHTFSWVIRIVPLLTAAGQMESVANKRWVEIILIKHLVHITFLVISLVEFALSYTANTKRRLQRNFHEIKKVFSSFALLCTKKPSQSNSLPFRSSSFSFLVLYFQPMW